MSQRIKVKEGDLFYIKLSDRGYAVGLVMHVSKSFKQSMIVGIFDRLFQSPDEIEPQKLVHHQR